MSDSKKYILFDENMKVVIFFTLSILLILMLVIYFVDFDEMKFQKISFKPGSIADEINLEQEMMCSDIEDLNKKESCEIKYSICDSDKCFYDKALVSLDETLCENISDFDLKNQCVININHNKIFQDAVIENNIDNCEKLLEKETVNACKDNFYYVQAFNLGDNSLCDMISEEVYKNECFNQ